MNAEVRYYVSIFFKRLPLFLLVSLSITSAAAALAVILPSVYVAQGSLLVESPRIPDNLAASTVQVGDTEALELVQRRVMTRTNLLDIARKHRVYEDIGVLNPDQIVSRMRSDTRFRRSSSRDVTAVMEIEFSARSGEVAAAVVNEYITRILADNADLRQSTAEDTLAFFEQEVDRLETELSIRNQEILDFQNRNSGALPDTLDYRMSRQTMLQERLSQIARERALLEDQRARLVRLAEEGGVRRVEEIAPQSPQARQISALRDELSSALAVYSEQSPRVQMIRSRIAALEEQVAGGDASAEAGSGGQGSGGVSNVELQISEIDAQLEYLEQQTGEIEAEVEKLDRTIQRTPNNAIALQALRRDYENIERQYDSALSRLSAASTGERIEVMSKGQRITVLDQAIAPSSPDSPNRALLAGAGAAAGIGAGVGLLVLLEILNKAIRRPVDLTNALGITPLATVPYIATPGQSIRRRLLIGIGVAAVVLGIPAAMYYVHYQIIPLDLLMDRVVTMLLP